MVKEEVQRHCIGHHVIDFPASFHVPVAVDGTLKERGAKDKDKTIEISQLAADYTDESFAAALLKRKTEITSLSGEKVDVLQLVRPLNKHLSIFRVQRINDAYRSELHLLRGKSYLVASVNSFDNQYEAAENRLLKLADGIHETASPDKGGRQGLCLGSVAIAGELQEESVNVVMVSKNYPGAYFEVVINTYEPDESISLLNRMSGSDSLFAHSSVKPTVLRQGEKTGASMRAQEWLGWIMLGDGDEKKKHHNFALETMRRDPGINSPHIYVSFTTGDNLADGTPVKTVLSDSDAMVLWDSVIKSIRPVPR